MEELEELLEKSGKANYNWEKISKDTYSAEINSDSLATSYLEDLGFEPGYNNISWISDRKLMSCNDENYVLKAEVTEQEVKVILVKCGDNQSLTDFELFEPDSKIGSPRNRFKDFPTIMSLYETC